MATEQPGLRRGASQKRTERLEDDGKLGLGVDTRSGDPEEASACRPTSDGGRGSRTNEDSVAWTVPKNYQLPRKVVVKCLETLDAMESPDRPGMMYMQTLQSMVRRFDDVFGNCSTEAKTLSREHQVSQVMLHLKRHTRRRRGQAVLNEGFIEWEQTSRVYELFSVNLNVFERIFFTLDVSESTSVLSQLTSTFLVAMIFVSILFWMVSTLPDARKFPEGCVGTSRGDCAPEPAEAFSAVERFCVYVFTVEYMVRLFTVHSVRFALLDDSFLEAVLKGDQKSAKQQGPIPLRKKHGPDAMSSQTGFFGDKPPPQKVVPHKLDSKPMATIKHVLSPSNLIDLFAILPFWIEKFTEGNGGSGALMVLRVLRLTRIFKVFKLGKYNDVFLLFSRVIAQSGPALSLMLFFISLGCCLFGTLIWFAESGIWYPEGHPDLLVLGINDRGAFLRHDGSMNPDSMEESPFFSIIHTFWYVIVTITTVGYGDVYPTTLVGKLMGALCILCGIIVLAMPIGVVGSNFSVEYHRVMDDKKRRARLKQQLDALAAVEEEQDAALSKDADDSQDDGSPTGLGSELHRLDAKRQRILVEAEMMDAKWKEKLPEMSYGLISNGLRYFLRDFLDAKAKTAESGPVAKPVVSLRQLEDLDVLTSHVHTAIASATATEDLAEFGLREARELRTDWAAFADHCWGYVVDMCRLEKPEEPPEFYEMKSTLVRTHRPHNLRSSKSITSFHLLVTGESATDSREAGTGNAACEGGPHESDAVPQVVSAPERLPGVPEVG